MANDDEPLPDDPKDFPVPPRSGPLRWSKHERALLNRLITLFDIDPSAQYALDLTRANDSAYLSIHHARWPLFSRHPKKNFYQNVRRAAREKETADGLRGRRRQRSELLHLESWLVVVFHWYVLVI